MPSIAELSALAEELQRNRDEEYFRNHPWERPSTITADMFGDLRDNPMVRAARELQYDRNVADERAKAWISNRRDGESVDDILKSVYGPIAASQAAARGVMPGLPQSIERNRLTTYKSPGGGVIGVDPETREVVRLVEDAPPKPVAEKPQKFMWEQGLAGLRPDTFITMTPSQFREGMPNFPEFARTNAYNRALLGDSVTGTNAFTRGFDAGAGTLKGKPTRSKAAEYVKKFGHSSAMEKLKSEGFDISGYAD